MNAPLPLLYFLCSLFFVLFICLLALICYLYHPPVSTSALYGHQFADRLPR